MTRPTVFVAFDGLQSLDLAGPWEVLSPSVHRARFRIKETSI